MLEIESFHKALKCSWIKNYLDEENNIWQMEFFLDLELEQSGGKMPLTCNMSKNDLLHIMTPSLPKGPLLLNKNFWMSGQSLILNHTLTF